MLEKIALTVLCLFATLALAWGIHEHSLAGQMQFERDQAIAQKAQDDNKIIADLRESLRQQQLLAESLKKQAASAAADLDKQKRQMAALPPLPPTPAAPPAGKAKVTPTPDPAAAKVSPAKPFMASMAKMMKDPAMRKSIQSQQKAMLDTAYNPLYDMLNLPTDKLDSFKGILEKKQTDTMNLGLELMDESLTPEQKAEKQKQIKDLNDQADKDLKALLGKDNYDVYKSFEETQPERTTVNQYNQRLSADLQLSDQQQNDLVFAMHQQRNNFHYTVDLSKEKGMDMSSMSPETFGQYIQETRQLNTQYVDAASKLLAPPQLDKFKATLDNQTAMMELGFNMLFGGAAKTPAPPKGK